MRSGKPRIVINKLESAERQRFTLCHEIAHVALGLASNHEEVPSWSYAKRHENEVFCDMFAAELLMPYEQFKASVDAEDPSRDLIERLGVRYQTSYPATASRLAALTHAPCAFVTMDRGIVRYASRSTSLRDLKAWIAPRSPIPIGSAAYALRESGEGRSEPAEVAQDIWFSDWQKGCALWETARHYHRFDQTFSLLYFEEQDFSVREGKQRDSTQLMNGLEELSGILPWPSGKRRR